LTPKSRLSAQRGYVVVSQEDGSFSLSGGKMKKIPSLFMRDYEGTRQVYDEIVPGCEWVAHGEGTATVKYDGTACMVRDGVLFKRYDRKLKKGPYRRKKRNPDFVPALDDYKSAPDGWEACEPEPNHHTGHWPGWMPVTSVPEDVYHRKAWDSRSLDIKDGTHELVGPKIAGNPYNLGHHYLWKHGTKTALAPRTFDELKKWFEDHDIEGLVWHHPDGRMCKIKRRDFGLPWPII
jgi:hypothetical protein